MQVGSDIGGGEGGSRVGRGGAVKTSKMEGVWVVGRMDVGSGGVVLKRQARLVGYRRWGE